MVIATAKKNRQKNPKQKEDKMSYQKVENIPTRQSDDIVWVNWYKDLRKTLSVRQANSIFAMAWSAQDAGNSDANTSALRLEMQKYGIDIESNVLGMFADFGNKTAGYFGDIFTYYKWISLGLGTVFAVSLGVFFWQLGTKSEVRREVGEIGATVASRGLNKVK